MRDKMTAFISRGCCWRGVILQETWPLQEKKERWCAHGVPEKTKTTFIHHHRCEIRRLIALEVSRDVLVEVGLDTSVLREASIEGLELGEVVDDGGLEIEKDVDDGEDRKISSSDLGSKATGRRKKGLEETKVLGNLSLEDGSVSSSLLGGIVGLGDSSEDVNGLLDQLLRDGKVSVRVSLEAVLAAEVSGDGHALVDLEAVVDEVGELTKVGLGLESRPVGILLPVEGLLSVSSEEDGKLSASLDSPVVKFRSSSHVVCVVLCLCLCVGVVVSLMIISLTFSSFLSLPFAGWS